MKIFKGVSISKDIAVGTIFRHYSNEFMIPQNKIKEDEIDQELDKLDAAIKYCKDKYRETKNHIKQHIDRNHARIIDGQLLMLQENCLIRKTKKLLKNQNYNIAKTFHTIVTDYEEKLRRSRSKYQQERYQDLRNIKNIIINKILNRNSHRIEPLKSPSIVAGDFISLSDFFELNPDFILGLITREGGKDSHLAIIAEALKLPYVSEIENLDQIDELVLDADAGKIIINPDKITKKLYNEKLSNIIPATYIKCVKATKDGTPFRIDINLDVISELEGLNPASYNGIGLFRTEFMALKNHAFPSEAEQIQSYNYILDKIGNKPITIRTFDFGRDKFFDMQDKSLTQNNFDEQDIGGIKLCLENPEILETQFRALLKVSTKRPFRIMLPMITDIGQVQQARTILSNIQKELDRKNIKYKQLQLGAMIETCEILEDLKPLSREVAFFSIGTNDLAHFLLGTDNRYSDSINQHYHPLLYKKIKKIIRVAKNQHMPVSLCGEMASDPRALIGLTAIGIRNISVNTGALTKISKEIKNLDINTLENLDSKIINSNDPARVQNILTNYYNRYLC